MGWIGVDLDGTLAQYEGFQGSTHIGPPVEKMATLVKTWLAEGKDVRLLTARANDAEAVPAIRAWCREHLGQVLPITACKDYSMWVLYDDRCVQVERNTGRLIGVDD